MSLGLYPKGGLITLTLVQGGVGIWKQVTMTINMEHSKNGSPSQYIRHNQRNIANARGKPNGVEREENNKIGISLQASLFN